MNRPKDLVKVAIPVRRNSDGFPPLEFEWIWAIKRSETTAEIDNVPFFSTWCYGDLILIENRDHQYWGVSVIRASGNSTFVLQVPETLSIEEIRSELRARALPHEAWAKQRLISVCVPPSSSVADVLALLRANVSHALRKLDW